MTEQVREGGCGCGAVRYRIVGEPIFTNNCHCRQCQRQTGSTSVVNAFFESERFTLLSGELVGHTVPSGSGGPHEMRRCSTCGGAILSHFPPNGRHLSALRVGTLDDPGAFTPDAVIFASEKMPWVTLPEGVPAFERDYRHRELLPPERFERLKALARRAAESKG